MVKENYFYEDMIRTQPESFAQRRTAELYPFSSCYENSFSSDRALFCQDGDE